MSIEHDNLIEHFNEKKIQTKYNTKSIVVNSSKKIII